jgi:hypothetical protein
MRFVSDVDFFPFLYIVRQASSSTAPQRLVVLKMYHLPPNWTAQRSAEQESEMRYLARIRKGEAKGAMDSTITTI